MPTPLSVYVGSDQVVPSTGERLVFMVKSRSNPKIQHRVCFTSNEGAGRCSCMDFATRKQPNIDAGLPSLTKATRCWHLEIAHTVFLRELLHRIASDERE